MSEELEFDKQDKGREITVDLLSEVMALMASALESQYRGLLKDYKYGGGALLSELDVSGVDLNVVKLYSEEQLDQEAIDKTKDFIVFKAAELTKEVREFGDKLNEIIGTIKAFRYQDI